MTDVMTEIDTDLLPRRGRGRPSAAAEAEYRPRLKPFCDLCAEGDTVRTAISAMNRYFHENFSRSVR